MSQLKYGPSVGWKGLLSLGCIVVALLTLGLKCNSKDPRWAILEEQAKLFLISEAQEGFRELFKTSFKPDKTRLILGADLQKWFQKYPGALEGVPDEIKESIKNNRAAGLLIEGALPDKTGGNQDVVYLRPSSFGVRRYFALSADPCGGQGTKCENCTGCSGETEPGGTIKTCVCTQGCSPNCRTCPSC